MNEQPRWTQEDLQRVLFMLVTRYEEAVSELGGGSELLRDGMRIARSTLIDNNWWPKSAGAS